MSNNINILHLSDLHFTRKNNAYDQRVVLEALKSDIREICVGKLRPDMVIFSGDLVQGADEEEIYLYFFDDLIGELSEITGCGESRIFLCPGNHDLHQSEVLQSTTLHMELANRYCDRKALNAAYLSGEIENFVGERFSGFRLLQGGLGKPKPLFHDELITVESVDGLPVDVISMNTAWFSGGGTGCIGGDERRLLFPEAAVVKAMDYCNADHLRVFVSHHPTNWLTEFCECDILNSVSGLNGELWVQLFGHMHDPRPAHISNLKGQCVENQSGALFSGRNRYIGYSLLRLEAKDGHASVHMRSYYDDRKVFDKGVNKIGKDGVWYSSPDSEKYWYDLDEQVDRHVLQNWIKEVLQPIAAKTYDDGISDKSLCEVFVPPPMHLRTKISGGDADSVPESREKSISISEIVADRTNYILHGQQETGKTTLLQQISLILMERSAEHISSIQLPIVVEFSEIRPGTNSIERAVRAGLPCDLDGFKLSNLLEEGLLVLLFDDVNFSDRVRMNLLSGFVSRNPRARYLFASLTDPANELVAAFGSDVAVTTDISVVFQHLYIEAFKRKDIRALVEKWNPSGLVDTEEVLNRLVKEIRSMQIAPTAVTSTILLSIYESEPDFKPINRATLIEQFIEHVLEKQSITEAFRGKLDFHGKVHILAYLAEYMARNDKSILPETEVRHVIQSFLDEYGLLADVSKIVKMFSDVRILASKTEGQLCFRYGAFHEFFVASRMRFNDEFKSWVLDESRYLSFINDIQYYAGLVRTDSSLLEMMSDRFERMNAELCKVTEWTPDPTKMETLELPSQDSKENLFEDFEKQIEAPPLNTAERDEVLEAELPRNMGNRQAAYRPKMDHIGHRWTVGLILYSGILKNLEMIPDQLKRDNLSRILSGWATLTMQSLFWVPTLARDRYLILNGIRYNVQMPMHYSEARVAREISLDLPKGIAGLVMWNLGTEKLEKQLSSLVTDDAIEPMIVTFFRHTLIADLRLSGWTNSIVELIDKLENSDFLLECSARKVAELYYLGGHKPPVEKKLKQIVGEAIATLKGSTKTDRRAIKSNVIDRIERQDRIRRLQVLQGDGGDDRTQ